MLSRRMGIVGAAGICVLACVMLARAWQEAETPTPAPETLLPQDSVLYFRFDGVDAHETAWKQSATYEAGFKSGLLDSIYEFASPLLRQMVGEHADHIFDAVGHTYHKGISVAGWLRQEDEGLRPGAVVVLHDGAKFGDILDRLLTEDAGKSVKWEKREIQPQGAKQAREATVVNADDFHPGFSATWWKEGNHLVLTFGVNAAESIISVAEYAQPNITTSERWKNQRAPLKDVEIDSVGWLDWATIERTLGEIPVPIDGERSMLLHDIFEIVGIDTLQRLEWQSGYQGKATWSEFVAVAPGPRKGILSLLDQQPMTLADLPPLPKDTTGFLAFSFNWTAAYDMALQLARDIGAIGGEEPAQEVENFIANIPATIGFDPRADLTEALGNVVCIYSDAQSSMFGFGFGLAMKVKDAEKLRETRDVVLELIRNIGGEDVKVQSGKVEGHDVTSVPVVPGVFMPTVCVHDEWLILGMSPSTIRGFLARSSGKVPKWEPTAEYQEALSVFPKEFVGINVSDPRSSYRNLMTFVPMANMFVQQQLPGGNDVDAPLLSLPPAELVTAPLFPNVTVYTSDAEGARSLSRYSATTIPLLGGSTEIASVSAVAIGAALLLPAIQQAREAARRTQSRNHLKQIAIALHSFHDVKGKFPSGTRGENFEPDERISWMAEILQFIDEPRLYGQLDFNAKWSAEENKVVFSTEISSYLHPSVTETSADGYALTHYVGLAGLGEKGPTLPVDNPNAGFFGYNRSTRMRDILDGTANTAAVSEASADFGPWGAGGKATLRSLTEKPYINGPDGIGSTAPEGCNIMFADGSVRFVSKDVDPTVLEGLMTIAGGEAVNLED